MRHKETKKPPVKRVANELPIIEVVREAVKRTSKMIEPGGGTHRTGDFTGDPGGGVADSPKRSLPKTSKVEILKPPRVLLAMTPKFFAPSVRTLVIS